ncbi:DEAD/DEAH box helicase family protein [Burkholderia gladioli]|uniref:DEAD/DEAH box helicase family protein n=1 Tax=Burkholderia gladioli TaxID=28095 RepID=UPI001C229529|nr:DEAD/DEAH box helicase family protein [Burkholderia gladioli]MBU9275736.1 DEAD/DEAH box helicase family protein [Burkholderia gladioli]
MTIVDDYNSMALRRHYDTDDHDVLEEFYRPLLRSAFRYDRAVGYFSAATLRDCASELADFIDNAGRVRLVIGTFISQEELDAIGPAENGDIEKAAIKEQLTRQLRALADSNISAAAIFAQMVASGIAELKFAVRDNGIYHEKFGVFEDIHHHKVAFIGSINETKAALSIDGNHESFSVYKTAEPAFYEAYGLPLEHRFDRLWKGETKSTRIYDVDEESIDMMREIISRSRLIVESNEPEQLPSLAARYKLRPYQEDALQEWKKNRYRGILAMATGTGKTLTAIEAVKRFKAKVPTGAVVITVPYQNLALQWLDALRDQGLPTISVFQSYTSWYPQVKNIFLAAQMGSINIPCLVCVNDTFKDDRFQELLSFLDHAKETFHFLLIDECHHFNSPQHIKTLPKTFGFRLGLSATPYDQFSEHFLDEYFDRIIFEFPLHKAIEAKFLTKYRYHILPVYLDEDESEAYDQITHRILQIAGSDDGFTPEKLPLIQPLLLRRSRIVGAARNKLQRLRQHLLQTGRTPYSLFYCGDGSVDDDGSSVRQIEMVSTLLHDLGWRSSRITADESLKTREILLDSLKSQSIDAVVSIKVLDEGIDIPECRIAYLLASQSSDRQGIQRRGRVLRKSEGKDFAELYDFVVVGGTTGSKALENLRNKELRRATQFANDAANADIILKEISELQ